MAYGARLESVLGESPRGFESPILRGIDFFWVLEAFFARSRIADYETPGRRRTGRAGRRPSQVYSNVQTLSAIERIAAITADGCAN